MTFAPLQNLHTFVGVKVGFAGHILLPRFMGGGGFGELSFTILGLSKFVILESASLDFDCDECPCTECNVYYSVL